MKKKICSLALLATAGVGSMFMSACGDPALESISVKDGSIETTLLVGSTPDWNDLVLNLNYENDETATATKNADMQISEIDTNVLGEQELVIKYKGLTTKVKIHIVAHEDDLYDFLGYQKPDAYVLYEGNTRDASTTVDTEFMIGSHRYKVGDDNPFKFLPKITAINQNDQTVTVTEYTSDVTVKDLETGEVLTGEALDAVVAIDNAHSTFDFTTAAVGKSYEITVKPLNYDEDMPFDPITFSVDVVNAWNAYEAKDLARIEDNAQTASIWADKKEALGIDNTKIDGIVLHNDIEITKSDLPSTMFHPAGTIQDGVNIGGSLIDSRSFYTRDIDVNKTFSIHGNYFTIKTRNEGDGAIPMVEYLDHDGKFGHSAIFSFGGDNHGSPDDPQGNVVIENLSLKGNGSREGALDNGEPVNHKGLIGIISSAQNTTIENCLTRAFTSHVIVLGDYDYQGAENIACNINNSKMIDSFQGLMLAWGSRNNNINNSVMKESGGPLIISTHVDAKDTHQYANITVNNSVMESIVGGEEAWFDKNGATAIISLFRALNGLIKMHGADIITQNIGVDKIASFENALNQFNFLSVNMEDDNIFNKEVIESITTIKDANGNIISQQNMTNSLISALCQAGYISGTVGGIDKNPDNPEGDPIESAAAAPIFECGGSFITIDLPKALEGGDPMEGLALVFNDAEILAAIKQATNQDYPLVMISLENWEEHALCQVPALKALIGQKIANFFNGDYVNVYLGGQCLGCTFQMFHLDPQA